ncbi:phosphomannose isomerase type I [Ancylostoma ceylanicum]|uniref:Phosphomannose isomerase type I n=1 Tax=Ancylostoma ceylanicum TaxID=53326 RepID=A0A0D6M0P2_9BILA|nr:phosphomannose isomerase type I [Ancylostoma ceylanicum]
MAIALTDFELLCGFRPAKEIYENLKGAPEVMGLAGGSDDLKNLLGEESAAKAALKKIFTKIWSSPPEEIAQAVLKFVERIKQEPSNKLNDLIIRLDREYPGDCVECMACSDNTIRAGLTPKFKDIQTLCSNLTYAMSGPPVFAHTEVAVGTQLYAPPVPEFAVQAVNAKATHFSSERASSIVVVIAGKAHFKAGSLDLEVHRGDVIFISAAAPNVQIVNASTDFVCYRAFTPRR